MSAAVARKPRADDFRLYVTLTPQGTAHAELYDRGVLVAQADGPTMAAAVDLLATKLPPDTESPP